MTKSDATKASAPPTADGKFDVGGILLDRPFKIRRLGHFGINVTDMEAGLRFYRELLGFRITDIRDHFAGKEVPDEIKRFGDHKGYFFRYASDHHAFVMYNHNVRGATDTKGRHRQHVTINQITWQVGTLREVVDGHHWLVARGLNVVRSGRDMPGSNWHTYLMDPDWHQNELYYGIEQIGWPGHSKPWDMHDRQFRDTPELPQKSERQEVEDAKAKGVDLVSGFRDTDPLPEIYDVQGILLARPFKIVRIGPVRLFVTDIEASVAFYRDTLGFIVTEEVDYRGHRCVFLRNNTEHHSLALYPIALREVLGLSETTTLMSFGLQLANYTQLRGAKSFLEEHGVELRDFPGELTPGIDRSIIALDGNGHAIELYHGIEQIGWDGRPRPASARRKGAPGEWPDAIEPQSDSYMGEPFLGPWG